jgi:arylsulfatase
VAKGELERTIRVQISLGEGFGVGLDVGSAVDFTYAPPFAFTGGIEKVTVDLR